MNIISEKEINGRTIDGIKTILELSDEQFDKMIECLNSQKFDYLDSIHFYYTTDPAECPENKLQLGLEETFKDDKLIGRAYYGGKRTSIHDIFYHFENLLSKFEIGSSNFNRTMRLLETRNLEAFKKMQVDKNGMNRELLDKIFEILSNEETFNQFLDFENNKEKFAISGKIVELGEFLKPLGTFFGSKNKNGKLDSENTISSDFYIPELDIFKERYSQILDTYNLDRYTNPMYEFKSFKPLTHMSDRIIRQDEEPEWSINPDLHEAIYKGFPNDGTLEEKAMHIYSMLCRELEYDEGYFYRDRLKKDIYTPDFSQEHLEQIVPGSKITCWDFSRLYMRMINELDGDIEAVIISNGLNEGHYSVGFYTDKVSCMLEAINGKTEGFNDILKSKLGIKFEGIEIISDREGRLEKALDSVYPKILGKPPITIQEYLKKIKDIQTPATNNLEDNIKSFIEFLKSEGLRGNEAMQMLNVCSKFGLLGNNMKKSFLGQKNDDGYERLVAITTKNGAVNRTVYVIKTENLEMSEETLRTINSRLESDELVYEDEKYKLPDINEEGR